MSENKITVFNQNDYEIVACDVPYQGIFKVARYQLRYKLFKGGVSSIVHRELTERKSAAAVLPYDPYLDKVILIEQFRPGAITHPQHSPWMLEIVAGVIDRDENPTEVAYREAKEEADCDLLSLHPIYDYFVSPGCSNEYIWVFCGCIDTTHDGIFGLEEENEDIKTFIFSADEAFKLVEEGKVKTAPAIISLQWLKLNRERLRQLWQKK